MTPGIASPARGRERVEWPTLVSARSHLSRLGACHGLCPRPRALAGGSDSRAGPGAALVAAARGDPRPSDGEPGAERGAGVSGAGAAHPLRAVPRPAPRAPLRPAPDRPARRPGVRTTSTPRSGRGCAGRSALVLAANNTLLGRMVIGPFLGMYCLWRDDLRALRAGDRGVARAWALHLAGRGAGCALARAGGADAGLAVPHRLLAGALDPAHPHLPRASGARAGGRAQRDHRGSRAAVDPVSQQQLPCGAPRQPEAALVPAAGGVRAAARGVAAAERRLQLPLLWRGLRALPAAAEGPGGASDLDAAGAGRRATRIRFRGGRCARERRAGGDRRPADVRLARDPARDGPALGGDPRRAARRPGSRRRRR